MDTKQFRFIKHMLWPFPTTIEVGPGGITNKGKCVPWQDIKGFTYTVNEINGAPNYIIAYEDKSGGGHTINYMITLLGSRKKRSSARSFTTRCARASSPITSSPERRST